LVYCHMYVAECRLFFAKGSLPLKRITHAWLAAMLLITMILPGVALAEEPPSIETPRVCLMDAATGAVLYEKNAYEQAYPASTTKIMTCILVIEMCDNLNEVINVGSDFDTRGSLMNIVRGEEMRVIDLLYGTMMVSGNDAAYALAAHFGGTEAGFAELMNQKAAEIGMTNTHFVKSNGLHKDNHYSTAYDMALLGRYAMQNQTFRDIVGAEYFDVPASQWDSDGYHLENSNRLIHMMETDDVSYKYQYATGIKTGDTDQAGRCLVASAKKDGVELILVLFGDPQGDAGKFMRFENAPKLFEWGFRNYASVSVSELGLEPSLTLPVANGTFEGDSGLIANVDIQGKVIAGTRAYIDGILAAKDSISYTIAYPNGASALNAPINAGDDVGTISYTCNGATILTAALTAANSIDEIGQVIESDPSESPLIVDDEIEDEGSPWLFWILIIAALLITLVIIRIVLLRNARRRRRARARANRNARSNMVRNHNNRSRSRRR